MKYLTLILLFASCNTGGENNTTNMPRHKTVTIYDTIYKHIIKTDTVYKTKDSVVIRKVYKDSTVWHFIYKDSIKWATIQKDSTHWTTILKDSTKWIITMKDSLQIKYIPLFTDNVIKQIKKAGKIELVYTIKRK